MTVVTLDPFLGELINGRPVLGYLLSAFGHLFFSLTVQELDLI